MKFSDVKIILVCGGRDFRDYRLVCRALDPFRPYLLYVVHGAARGADSLAKQWCELNGVKDQPYPANWAKYGKGAGPKRNQQMLDEEPNIDLVIAFPGERGTLDMCERADAKGIPVRSVGWDWKEAREQYAR